MFYLVKFTRKSGTFFHNAEAVCVRNLSIYAIQIIAKTLVEPN